MSDISKKTPAQLIDELFTTDIKIFLGQEDLYDALREDGADAFCSQKSREIINLNIRRNKLMQAIDEALGFGDVTVTSKTFEEY